MKCINCGSKMGKKRVVKLALYYCLVCKSVYVDEDDACICEQLHIDLDTVKKEWVVDRIVEKERKWN